MTDTVAEPAEARLLSPPKQWAVLYLARLGSARLTNLRRHLQTVRPQTHQNPTLYPQNQPACSLPAAGRPLWTHSYHWHRPHSGIKQQTPIGHLNLNQNNLVRFHIYHLHPCRRTSTCRRAFAGMTIQAEFTPWQACHCGQPAPRASLAPDTTGMPAVLPHGQRQVALRVCRV